MALTIISDIVNEIIDIIVWFGVWLVVFGILFWMFAGWGFCWTFGPLAVAYGIPFDPFWFHVIPAALPALFFASLHVFVGKEPVILAIIPPIAIFILNLWWVVALVSYNHIEDYYWRDRGIPYEAQVEFLDTMFDYYRDDAAKATQIAGIRLYVEDNK